MANVKSQTGLNTIHRIQGALLSKSLEATIDGKKIVVVPLAVVEELFKRAIKLSQQGDESGEVQFHSSPKVDKTLARLHKLLDEEFKNLKE